MVEGGSRPYSEVVGHPSILRPQPVPCIAMPPLCHAVREPGCAYQTFCQPQLCCLHCRPTQSVPLDKYPVTLDKYPAQCAHGNSRSSPPSHPSCWEADASVPVHPPGAQPIQQSISHPGSDPVPHGTSSTLPRQPTVSSSRPLAEPSPADQTVTYEKRSDPCGKGQTDVPVAATSPEPSPNRDPLQVHNQTQVQTTTETSNQAMVELQPIFDCISGGRVSFSTIFSVFCKAIPLRLILTTGLGPAFRHCCKGCKSTTLLTGLHRKS